MGSALDRLRRLNEDSEEEEQGATTKNEKPANAKSKAAYNKLLTTGKTTYGGKTYTLPGWEAPEPEPTTHPSRADTLPELQRAVEAGEMHPTEALSRYLGTLNNGPAQGIQENHALTPELQAEFIRRNSGQAPGTNFAPNVNLQYRMAQMANRGRAEGTNEEEVAGWVNSKAAPYQGIRDNADYLANTKADEKYAIKGLYSATGKKAKYNYITNLNGFADNAKKSRENELTKYDFMTENERKDYTYIANTQGLDAAEGYLDYLDYDLNARASEAAQAAWAKNAQGTGNAVGASATSVLANSVSGLGEINLLGQNINKLFTGKPVDYNAPALNASKYTQTVRGQVAKDIEKAHPNATVAGVNLGSFLYQTGMSMADSAVVALLGRFGVPKPGVLLGSSVAVNATLNAKERGLTDAQALTTGVAYGIAEMLFEEVSLEKIIHPTTAKGVGGVVLNILRQAFTESSEEAATTLANTLTDALINGDKSEILVRQRELQAEFQSQGMSEEEAREAARKAAWKEWGIGLITDALGGAISGGVMGTGANVANYMSEANYRRTGDAYRQMGLTNDEFRDALVNVKQNTYDQHTEEWLDKLTDRAARGEDLMQKLPSAEIGKVMALQAGLTNTVLTQTEYNRIARLNESPYNRITEETAQTAQETQEAARQVNTPPVPRARETQRETQQTQTETKAAAEEMQGPPVPSAMQETAQDAQRASRAEEAFQPARSENAAETQARQLTLPTAEEAPARNASETLTLPAAAEPVQAGPPLPSRAAQEQESRAETPAAERQEQNAPQTLTAPTMEESLSQEVPKPLTLPTAESRTAETEEQMIERLKKSPAGLSQDEYTATMDQRTVKLLDTLAKKLGLRVAFADEVNRGKANADITGNVVLIEKGNPNPVRFLIGHEATHWMKRNADGGYNAFEKAARKADAVWFQNREAEIRQTYEKQGISIDEAGIREEALSDYAGLLADNSDTLERFITENKDNRGVLEKVRDFFRHIKEFLTGDERAKVERAERRLIQALQQTERNVAEGKGAYQGNNTQQSIKSNIDETQAAGYNNELTGGVQNGRAQEGTAGAELDGASGEGVSERWLPAARGDRAEGRPFRQGDISVSGVVQLSDASKQLLSDRSVGTVEMEYSTDHAAFSALLDEARAIDRDNGWAVTPKTVEDLENCRTFLSEDGGVGFALAPDGDIEAVFRNKQRHPQGRAMRSVIPQAIANGGTKLDCYGPRLARVYADAAGMVPVCRVTFNPEFANPGWTPDKGQPDIVFMMVTDTDADTIIQKQGTYHLPTEEEIAELPLFTGETGYDDAAAYRDRLLEERLKGTARIEISEEDLNNAVYEEMSSSMRDIMRRLQEDIDRAQEPEPKSEPKRKAQRVSDEAYMTALEDGNITEAAQMVRETADAAMPDSKVRSASTGELRYVYHYTDRNFYEFKPMGQSAGSNRTLGDGYYVSTSETEFKSFGKNKMQLFANITNPFEMSLTEGQAQAVYDKYFRPLHPNDIGKTYESHVLSKLQTESRVFDYLKEAAEKNGTTTSKILTELGFDGVHDGIEWVAFYPEQLKSADVATYNDDGQMIPLSERFNENEGDIRYSLKDAEKLGFDTLIDQYYKRSIRRDNPVYIGRYRITSDLFGSNAPLIITGSDLTKSVRKKQGSRSAHEVSESFMRSLPTLIEDASFGFTEDRNGIPSFTIIVADPETNALYTIGGASDVLYENQTVNRVLSIFEIGDPVNYLSKSHRHLVTTDKNRALEMLEKAGIQSPALQTILDSMQKVPQANGKVNPGSSNSLKESDSAYLSAVNSGDTAAAQRMVNEAAKKAGYDIKAYHGTSNYGFTRFDNYFTKFGLFGNGFYFTESPEVAESYTKKGKGTTPGVYSVFLKADKLIDMDEPADLSKWRKGLRDFDFDESYLDGVSTNEDAFRALKEAMQDAEMYQWEAEETVPDFIQEMGYDGITHMGGGRYGSKDGPSHRVYIVYDSSQVKSADPVTYDDNDGVIPLSERFNPENDDIRYSLKGLDADAIPESVRRYGRIKPGENPARDVQVPKKVTGDKRERVSQTIRTVLEAGATPDTAVPTLSELVEKGAYSYQVYSDKDAIAKAEDTIKDKGWEATLTDWVKDVSEGTVNKTNTAMGWALYNNAANEGDLDTALNVLDLIVRHQRNAAQAVQATRILKKLTPEAQLYGVQRSVDNLIAEIKQKYGKDVDIQVNRDLARAFLNAKTEAERRKALEALYKDVGRQLPSRFIDKWNAWRYLAMLGNPRTHVRNIVGNAGFAPVVLVKDQVGTMLESIAYRLSKGKMERTKGLVLPGWDHKLVKAAWDRYDEIMDEALGAGKYTDMKAANDAIQQGRVIFKFKPLEWARRGNSAALDKEDIWFNKPHYVYAMAQYCKANGITPAQIASGKGLEKAEAYAIKEAQKATYRDINAFSNFVSSIGRSTDRKTPVGKVASAVIEGILPFRRTPANILARGVEYSPLGLAKSLTYDMYQVMSKDADGNPRMSVAEMLDDVSAGLTGTGLLALGMLLSKLGLLRGHSEDDEKARNFDDLTGHQNYAIQLPNGDSYTLDWLAPEALPVFVGVNLYERMLKTKGEMKMNDLLQAVSSISEPMLEMSMLQGINDLLETVSFAKNQDTSALFGVLSEATISYLTQAVPTLLGQSERTGENVRMTTYTDKNKWLMPDLQYSLGKVSAKIPGWDYDQIPYIDAWGRTEVTGDGWLERAFKNMISPGYTDTVRMSDMEKELLRLYNLNPEDNGGVLPTRPGRKIGDTDLTGEQYVKYATKKGQLSYELATGIIKSAAYKKATDDERVALIKDAFDYANERGRAEALPGYKTSESKNWITKMYQTVKKTKVDEATYLSARYATSQIKGIPDDNGEMISNSAGLKKMDYLYGLTSLTDSQREAMMADFGVGEKLLETMPSKEEVTGRLAFIEAGIPDSEYKDYKIASGVKGIDLDTYMKGYNAYYDADGSGTKTNADWTAVLDEQTFSKDRAQDNYIKGVLWQLYTNSTSTKNNPYDKSGGQYVLDEKDKAKGGGGKSGGDKARIQLPTQKQPWEMRSEPSSGLRLPTTNAAPRQSSGLRLK